MDESHAYVSLDDLIPIYTTKNAPGKATKAFPGYFLLYYALFLSKSAVLVTLHNFQRNIGRKFCMLKSHHNWQSQLFEREVGLHLICFIRFGG
jgi:hypothetical protein